MSLTSVVAVIWNEIARTQKLQTEWARKAFAMAPDQMAELEDQEYAALRPRVGQQVAAAYQDMKPLLLERAAIAQFTLDRPQYLQALPEVASIAEAVILASSDRPLNRTQQRALSNLLQADLR